MSSFMFARFSLVSGSCVYEIFYYLHCLFGLQQVVHFSLFRPFTKLYPLFIFLFLSAAFVIFLLQFTTGSTFLSFLRLRFLLSCNSNVISYLLYSLRPPW